MAQNNMGKEQALAVLLAHLAKTPETPKKKAA
jgi:hypothetical protein